MHPSFEEKYELFVKQLIDKHNEEEQWTIFWKNEVISIKEIEWAHKRNKLIQKYRNIVPYKGSPMRDTKSGSATNKKRDVSPIPNKEIDEEFNFSEFLTLLSFMTTQMGLIGTALKALISQAQKEGSNSINALKVFVDDDNEMLLNMCLRKLGDITPKNASIIKTVSLGKRLPDYCRMRVKQLQNEHCGLNLRQIAEITNGKSSSFIVDYIKQKLRSQGTTNITLQKLNQIFLSISAIQFQLSCQFPNLTISG